MAKSAHQARRQAQESGRAAYKVNRLRVSKLLEENKDLLSKVLSDFMTAEKMNQVALSALSQDVNLLMCTDTSILACVMTSAQLGLSPDPLLGEIFFSCTVINKTTPDQQFECQLMIGYRGLISLAYRSGIVKTIEARPVFLSTDLFDYEFGLNEKLVHRPNAVVTHDSKKVAAGARKNENISYFYCLIRFKDGGHVFDVMTKEDVEYVRDESNNYKNTAEEDRANTIWGRFFKEMGQKTVLRRLMKFIPMSTEVKRAIGLDDHADAGIQKTSLLLVDTMPDKFGEAVAAEVVENKMIKKDAERARQVSMSKEVGTEAAASLRSIMADKKKKLPAKKKRAPKKAAATTK